MIRATFKPDPKRAGHYLQGIPARDLTEDEYRALNNSQRVRIRQSGLYEVLTDKEMAEAMKPVPKPKSEPSERAAPTPDAPTESEEA